MPQSNSDFLGTLFIIGIILVIVTVFGAFVFGWPKWPIIVAGALTILFGSVSKMRSF